MATVDYTALAKKHSNYEQLSGSGLSDFKIHNMNIGTKPTAPSANEGKAFDSGAFKAGVDAKTAAGKTNYAARASQDTNDYYKDPKKLVKSGSLSDQQNKTLQSQIDQKAEYQGKTQDQKNDIYAGKMAERDKMLSDSIEYHRDLQKEADMAAQLGVQTEGNEGDLYVSTYGNEGTAGLIENGEIDPNIYTAQKLQEMGFTGERLQKLMDSGYLSPELLQNMQELGGDLAVAESNLNATPSPNNTAMNVLSEMLNKKSNFKNQKLGTSDLFDKLGISGYAVLAQSMRQRSEEMGTKVRSAQGLVSEVGGAMMETYQGMADNAARLQKDFDKSMDRVLAIDKESRDNEFIMNKMEVGFQNDKEMLDYKQQLDIELMEKEKEMNPSTSYGAEGDSYLSAGGGSATAVYDEATGQVRPLQEGETSVGGKAYNKNAIAGVFGVGGSAGWCGTFASTLSTASKVGNSWAEKKQRIDYQDSPTAGDKLLVPLAVGTDGKGYGHVATVLDYNKETGDVWVVESNRDGRMNRGSPTSKVTFGVYNLGVMKTRYGDNFGFAKGEFKQGVKEKLNNTPQLKVASEDESWKAGVQGTISGNQMLDAMFGRGISSTILGANSAAGSGQLAGTEQTYAQRAYDITGDPAYLQVNDKEEPSGAAAKRLAAAMDSGNVDDYLRRLQEEESGGSSTSSDDREYI